MKIIAYYRNFKSIHNVVYSIEAGMCLLGLQVKSLRKGEICLEKCYGFINNGNILLKNLFLNSYQNTQVQLLLHRNQINKIIGLYSKEKRIIILESVYDLNGIIKCKLAVAERLTKHDKKQKLIEKDIKRREKYIDLY